MGEMMTRGMCVFSFRLQRLLQTPPIAFALQFARDALVREAIFHTPPVSASIPRRNFAARLEAFGKIRSLQTWDISVNLGVTLYLPIFDRVAGCS